jgi:hypothetical protein
MCKEQINIVDKETEFDIQMLKDAVYKETSGKKVLEIPD